MFEEPFFDHLVGAITQYFTYIMIKAEQIEQAIRAGKIVNPTKNKGFTEKKKDTNLNNLEKGSHHNSYQEPISISNVNFFNPFPKNQINTLNNQQNTPTERTFHPKNNFYRNNEQLPPFPILLGEMY